MTDEELDKWYDEQAKDYKEFEGCYKSSVFAREGIQRGDLSLLDRLCVKKKGREDDNSDDEFILTASDVEWNYYADAMIVGFDPDKCGKWIYHFGKDSAARVKRLCRQAVVGGYVRSCKHTSDVILEISGHGIVCFYLESDDIVSHQKILSFMMKNHLVPKCDGKYCDIRFKFDRETRTGEPVHKAVSLSDFVDLETGKFF